jgi:hypothetical protein
MSGSNLRMVVVADRPAHHSQRLVGDSKSEARSGGMGVGAVDIGRLPFQAALFMVSTMSGPLQRV